MKMNSTIPIWNFNNIHVCDSGLEINITEYSKTKQKKKNVTFDLQNIIINENIVLCFKQIDISVSLSLSDCTPSGIY